MEGMKERHAIIGAITTWLFAAWMTANVFYHLTDGANPWTQVPLWQLSVAEVPPMLAAIMVYFLLMASMSNHPRLRLFLHKPSVQYVVQVRGLVLRQGCRLILLASHKTSYFQFGNGCHGR